MLGCQPWKTKTEGDILGSMVLPITSMFLFLCVVSVIWHRLHEFLASPKDPTSCMCIAIAYVRL